MRPLEEIAAALDLRIAQGAYVGVIAGVYSEGRCDILGRGVADRGTGAPLDGTSLFEIGSICKALTGVLLALMEEAGELSVDEPVGMFLRDQIEMSSAFFDEVTLLDLATHHSGLPMMPPELEDIDLEAQHPDYPLATLSGFMSSIVPPDVRRYQYSNLGYGLLGLCLSARAKRPFDALLNERVLLPLGMTRTGFGMPESGAVTGHSPEGHGLPAWQIPELLHAAGGLRAPACDLLNLVAACLEPPGGPLGRAITSALRPRRYGGFSMDIGLGWETSYRFSPDIFVLKGGLTAGFSTNCILVPSRREGAVVLANSRQCLSDLSYYILDHRFGMHWEACWEPPFLAPPFWYDTLANPVHSTG
ncbi:serine hydrolase domain-containing protein [Azospirillum brasilense]|uniref:serine hydrolase domain-containing protein n=1 Tax=Azospirillum brasilense TaxID=192 RepID=UPI0013B35AFD|nr:serine hydrolase [Azospirillum brasilense]